MAIRARVGSALRRTGRLLVRRPRLAAWATVGVIAAALVFGAALIAARNLDRWADDWRGGATMVVYLQPGAAPERGQAIAAELGAIAGVVRAELVPAEEAARRLHAALGADDALLAGVDPGALPASVELVLEPGAREVVAASPLFATLRGADAVDSVELVGEWDDRIGALLGGLRTGAWTLAALFGVLALVAVTATLRLRLAASVDEARIARLLGAGPGFLVAPSMIAGALQGAFGAALALPILFYLHHELGPSITAAVTRAIGGGEVVFLSAPGLATIVLAGGAIGAIGGMLAEGRGAPAYGS
jgi:cell division transport system permease protein